MHGLLGPMVFKAARHDIRPQKIFQVEYSEGDQKVIRYKNGVLGLPTMVTRMTQDAVRNRLIDAGLQKLYHTPGITKILVISDRRDHLMGLYDYYATTFSCGLYIGQLKKHELEHAKNQRVIFASYGMANEFLDIADLNGLLLATPASGNIEQIIGKPAVYPGCLDLNEDLSFEEKLEFIFKTQCLSHHMIKSDSRRRVEEIIEYIQKYAQNSRQRIVIDIVDTFDVFHGMAWKRFHNYKKLKYFVHKLSSDEFKKISRLN